MDRRQVTIFYLSFGAAWLAMSWFLVRSLLTGRTLNWGVVLRSSEPLRFWITLIAAGIVWLGFGALLVIVAMSA